MTNVIVAFATEEQCARCASALEAGGIPVSLRCTSFGGVRRVFDLCGHGVLVCACRLPDGTVDDLAWDLGERAIVVAVGKAAQLETCEHPKLFRLRLPCSRGELASAVNMLLQLQRMRQPNRSEGEKRAIAEAKALLMNKFAMTEPEAHHSLQKRAMDQGLKLPEMAARILASNA